MSRNQLKIDALNTGFEKIVLLDEFQEEIDVPPVIKTPLGNYLVCYTKVDTVILSPEIFGAWTRRHGAVGYAALDEPVEEVSDAHFCLRFASEINEVKLRGKQTGPPEGAILPEVDQGGDADPEIHSPEEPGVPGPSGDMQTPEEFMCLHNRTVADAYICLGTTGNLGLNDPGKPLLPAVVQQYHRLVGAGHVSCSNLRHLHVSDRRSVFYELRPGDDTDLSVLYRVHLSAVEYPQQPKDPCEAGGVPVPSWSLSSSNLFGEEELLAINSRWDIGYKDMRHALSGGDEAWKEFLLSKTKQELLDSLPSFLGGARSLTPGVVTGTPWRNIHRTSPEEMFYRCHNRTVPLELPFAVR